VNHSIAHGEREKGLRARQAASVKDQVQEGQQLAQRLERLSADSHWAHQASGLRGALLRCLEEAKNQVEIDPQTALRLAQLVQRGQWILVKAARLIRTPDTQFD
jgi:hypothetical protein